MNKDFDFVAIGDMVVDAFIKLEHAKEVCNANTGKCELCISYPDKVPYEFMVECPAVGNSSNAAVSAARLGLKSALIANIGDDHDGEKCIESLKKDGVDPEFVKVNSGMKTNYHYVLWYQKDRTILIKHENYPEIMPDIGSPKWLYLSSMGEKTLAFHGEIEKYLDAHPDIKLVFQPGTFQMEFGTEALAGLYKKTKIFFCNVEEAQRILKTGEKDHLVLLKKMQELGPEVVVITDGPNGAYAYYGDAAIFMPAYPDPKPPYERTGAGDAYASTFTSAIILGKNVEEALKWASINSAYVVQDIGAQKGLQHAGDIEKYLREAPADWIAKKIN